VAPILGYACRIALSRSKAAVTPVVWTFSALADLEGIRRHIGNFNPYAARDMADRIIEAGNSLANFPYRGRQVLGTQLRETMIARPYVIRYRVERDRVIILRIRHDALKPKF
jgi:toxin ParE1/3/4